GHSCEVIIDFVEAKHNISCTFGKPQAMHHLPHRFNSRNSGFPTSPQALSQFNAFMPKPATL
ncbi:hypothetical protein AMECASPLE_039059, partial [Ameca splendens]